MKSKIEWTEETLNWISGCNKVSPGCKNCYANRMTNRLQAMGIEKYKEGFNKVVIHAEVIQQPLTKRKPRTYFVNSMADTFHKEIPNLWLITFFDMVRQAKKHTFQVLTKRHERMFEFNQLYSFKHLKNLWLGVSVERSDYVHRIDFLRQTDAYIKFLSCEPLLGSLRGINLEGIDWVIVGGESGPGARPMKKDWVIEIKEACKESNTKFFFKQWGGVNKKKTGRLLDGKEFNDMPIPVIN